MLIHKYLSFECLKTSPYMFMLEVCRFACQLIGIECLGFSALVTESRNVKYCSLNDGAQSVFCLIFEHVVSSCVLFLSDAIV